MFLLFMLGVERVPCAHSGFIWTGCVWGAQRQWGGGAGAVGGGGSCHAGRPLTAWPAFTLPAFLTSAHWVSLPWDFIAALNRISARAALSVFLC